MEIDGLLGASTDDLTNLANEMIDRLTPMGVGVVAGMLLCRVARAAPTEVEGWSVVDKTVGSASAVPRPARGGHMIEFAQYSEQEAH
jgi:hypothetical protein